MPTVTYPFYSWRLLCAQCTLDEPPRYTWHEFSCAPTFRSAAVTAAVSSARVVHTFSDRVRVAANGAGVPAHAEPPSSLFHSVLGERSEEHPFGTVETGASGWCEPREWYLSRTQMPTSFVKRKAVTIDEVVN